MKAGYRYYAHTVDGKPESDWQLLADHLRNVAKLAAGIANEARPGDDAFIQAALWTGMLHDMGKYTNEFQAYLRKAREAGSDTHHAVFGAAKAVSSEWCGPAFAIAGHHAGLHDVGELQSLVVAPKYMVPERLPETISRFQAESGAIPDVLTEPAFAAQVFHLEFYIRMLFSCLTDADILDTEGHREGKGRSVVRLSDVICSRLLDRLIDERDSKSREGTVNCIRHAVFDRCLTMADGEPGFYSLTVPTGGGKTLSGMAFALAHARRHKLRRIIVVIPYLSIIEQNAAEYRRILDPDDRGIVIEHHSAIPVSECGERYSRSSAELAAENWDAPVVVTTSVQFIESLFANTPSKCRKLHNIARSIVLLDEVQTIPVRLLNPLLNVFRELKENYGVTFLFSTATQPAFRRRTSLPEGFQPGEVTEIVEDQAESFRILRRVDYKREGVMDWKTLAGNLAASSQALCVVNVRKHAFDLWEALRDAISRDELDSLFHLSSAMCAEHRLWTLGKIEKPREGSIRHRLKAGLPCRVVSTQVVEAGVDLDFPIVFRSLGPLDSIVQAAGRCNREGRLKNTEGRLIRGQVVLFTPTDPVIPPGIYRTATMQTIVMLQRAPLESLGTDPALFGDYFDQLFQVAPTDHARGRETTIQEDRESLRFREVARKAKVIEDDGMPVVVPYGKGEGLIRDIRARGDYQGRTRFTRHDLRTLQRFIVNVRQNDYQFLHHHGMVSPLLPNLGMHVLKPDCYHPELGLLVRQRPLEDLCGV